MNFFRLFSRLKIEALDSCPAVIEDLRNVISWVHFKKISLKQIVKFVR